MRLAPTLALLLLSTVATAPARAADDAAALAAREAADAARAAADAATRAAEAAAQAAANAASSAAPAVTAAAEPAAPATAAPATAAATPAAEAPATAAGGMPEKPKTKNLTKPFTVGPFTRVAVSGDYDVEIVAASFVGVVAKGDMPGIDRVTAVVTGDTLTLGQGPVPAGAKDSMKVKLLVQTPTLSGVQNDSPKTTSVSGFGGGSFAVGVGGKGTVTVKKLRGTSVDAALTGDGEIYLEGTCDTLKVKAGGAGTVRSRDLRCGKADVEMDGKATVSVDARDKLVAKLSGTGTFYVEGKPGSVSITQTGLSDVDFDK